MALINLMIENAQITKLVIFVHFSFLRAKNKKITFINIYIFLVALKLFLPVKRVRHSHSKLLCRTQCIEQKQWVGNI